MLKALSWYYVCSRIMRAGACMPAKKVREEEDRFKACWSLISSICIDHAFLVCIKKHTAQYKMDLQVSITNNTCAIEVNSSSGRNISLCRAGINHTPHGNTQHDCSHMSTYWPHQSLVPSSRSSLQHPRRLRNANRMSDGRRIAPTSHFRLCQQLFDPCGLQGPSRFHTNVGQWKLSGEQLGLHL